MDAWVARVAALFLVALACGQRPVSEPVEPVPEPPPPATEAPEPPAIQTAARAPDPAAAPLPLLGSDLDHDEVLELLQSAPARRFKPVGTTSIVYQLRLDAPIVAAFKPRTRQHPRGDRAEVAAYRVARCLGMENVPPAVTRRFSRREIRAKLHPAFIPDWLEFDSWTGWSADRSVTGAAIYWIPNLRSLGMDGRSEVRRWSRRLHQGGRISSDAMAVHADLASMVAFDYLIGNYDRFSGGNVQGPPDGSRLFIRDHNVAFAVPLPSRLHARLTESLLRTEKFSRAFVQKLLRMTEPRLRQELGRDPGAERYPSLTDAQIAGVMDRRESILSYIVALIDAYGEDQVLVFP